MHAAIQVVYCHYMLMSFVECLWYVKFLTPLFEARRKVNGMNDQRTNYGTRITFFGTTDSCLDVNRHSCEKS